MTLLLAIYIGFLVFGASLAIARLLGQRQARLLRRLRQVTAFSREQATPVEHEAAVRRVLGPVWDRLTLVLAGMTPVRLRRQIAEKLVEAGNPHGLKFDGFIGLVAASVTGFALLFGGLGFLVGMRFLHLLLMLGAGIGLGFIFPLWLLSRWMHEHKKQILRQLPEALDVLTISVEAGLSFDAALAKLIEKSKGPLITEFGRMLKEISMGKARSDAINDLGKRKRIGDLTFFTTALAHSDKLGVPIGSILRVQSDEIRRRHRQRVEFEAMQTPIKMIFPLALCIFPALMIVLLAPAALMIANSIMFK